MQKPAELTTAPLHGEPLPVELMNTIWADRSDRHDAIADAAGLAAWLRAVGPRLSPLDTSQLTAGSLSKSTVRLYVELRDGLRRLAATATDDPRPAAASDLAARSAALAALNRASRSAAVWPELTWRPALGPRSSIGHTRSLAEAALTVIAREAVELFAGPDGDRLRACLAPGCVLYFVRDHPAARVVFGRLRQSGSRRAALPAAPSGVSRADPDRDVEPQSGRRARSPGKRNDAGHLNR